MLFKRDDEIWEVECTRCAQKLSEVIVGDMPKTGQDARVAAMMAGWNFTLTEDLCWGCRNVSE